MNGAIFEISFASEIFHVKNVVQEALEFISNALPRLSIGDLQDLKLIFSELLFNAVIHGNRQDRSKIVRVKIFIEACELQATVSDEGVGFDHIALLSHMENFDNLTSESGRGMRLVYSLTDAVIFNGVGNEIKFHKRMALNG